MSTRGSLWLHGVLWTSCTLVLVGLGSVAYWSSISAAERELLEHELVAERVIDEVEREISALLLTDESRPFHQWRHSYLPAGATVGAEVVRSPLSWSDGQRSEVLGWFQLEPGGEVVSPRRPGVGAVSDTVTQHEKDLAGWTAQLESPDRGGDVVTMRDPGTIRRARTVIRRLRSVATTGADDPPVLEQGSSSLDDRESDSPDNHVDPAANQVAAVQQPLPQPVDPQQVQQSVLNDDPPVVYAKSGGWAGQRKALNLNRGADMRQQRSGQVAQVSDLQASNYVNPGNTDNDFAIEQQQAVQHQVLVEIAPVEDPAEVEQTVSSEDSGGPQATHPPAAPAAAVPVFTHTFRSETVYDDVVLPARRPAPLEVRVDPFDVVAGPQDTLLQYRAVHIGGQSWTQGVVMSRSALQDRVTSKILSSLAVDAPALALSWPGEPTPDGAVFSFGGDLAPPFEELHPTVHLPRLPGTGGGQGPVWVAAGLAGLVLVVGTAVTSSLLAARLRLAEARSDFASAITHELRTPLTTIRMYVEMLEQGVVTDDEGRQRYLRTVRQEAERLGRLVEDVLAFARLDRGRRLPSGRPGSLGDALDEALTLARLPAEAVGCTLLVEIEPDVRSVQTDIDAIVQVVHNLVDNGVKFGAQADSPQVSVRAAIIDGVVVLRVQDRGPGVDRKVQKRMFQPFVRG
ncbi:MAG: signal transduction histidine kinase, partial [Kiritimatiellia bacterium]